MVEYRVRVYLFTPVILPRILEYSYPENMTNSENMENFENMENVEYIENLV